MIPKGAEKAIAKHFEILPDIRRLASQATYDLYNGPACCDEGEDEEDAYPGFSAACDAVREWCDDNLHDVWYDSQSGFVCDSEPEGYDEECYECGGTGNDPSKADEDDDAEDGDCPVCCGRGERWAEPEWEDYYHFEARDVKRALFDEELVQYI